MEGADNIYQLVGCGLILGGMSIIMEGGLFVGGFFFQEGCWYESGEIVSVYGLVYCGDGVD